MLEIISNMWPYIVLYVFAQVMVVYNIFGKAHSKTIFRSVTIYTPITSCFLFLRVNYLKTTTNIPTSSYKYLII